MGDKDKPWDNRKRAIPLRTYSGEVKYKKKLPKPWTVRDIKRILARIDVYDISDINEVLDLYGVYMHGVRILLGSLLRTTVTWEIGREMVSEAIEVFVDWYKSLQDRFLDQTSAITASKRWLVRRVASLIGFRL